MSEHSLSDKKTPLERIQHYIAMRDAKPFAQLADPIHGIHTGTEWAAELNLADLKAVISAFPSQIPPSELTEAWSEARAIDLTANKDAAMMVRVGDLMATALRSYTGTPCEREKALANALQTVLDDWANANMVGDDARADAERALDLPSAPSATLPPCQWIPDDDGVYHTTCRNAFTFIDAGPKENSMVYCCYCGGALSDGGSAKG